MGSWPSLFGVKKEWKGIFLLKPGTKPFEIVTGATYVMAFSINITEEKTERSRVKSLGKDLR